MSAFQSILSSDDSDMSDDEKNDVTTAKFTPDTESSENFVPTEEVASSELKVSKNLEIVENRKNVNKRFSIWSEILMEEELNESMNNSLKLKKRRRKPRKDVKDEKESDNYAFWTKEDFARKFGMKKSNALKMKLKGKQLKRDPAIEISRQLKESRIDIIKRIVQVIGEEKTRKLTMEVLDIESGGGMMTSDGKRKRSPGGTLFYLIKNEAAISSEDKRSIFCDTQVKMNDKQRKKSQQQNAANKSNVGKRKRKSKKSKNKKA